MNNTTQRILIATTTSAITLAFAGALWWAGDSAEQAPQTVEDDPSADRVGDSATTSFIAAGAEDSWRPPHLKGRYQLRYHMKMGQPDEASKVDLTLTAVLITQPAEIDDQDRLTLLATLEEVRLHAQGAKATSLGDLGPNPEQALARPWRMTLKPDGTLHEAHFHANTQQSARAILQGIAAAAQLSIPKPAREDRQWTLTEEDVNGTYEALYKRAEDDPDTITRTFAVNPPERTGKAPVAMRANSTSQFHIDEAERLAQLHYNIDMDFDLAMSGETSLRSSVEIKLERIGNALTLAFTEGASMANQRLDRAALAEATALSPQDEDRAMVRGRSYQELIKTIERAGTEGNWQLRAVTSNDLGALLRLEPKLASKVGDTLRDGVDSEPVRRSLIESLAEASTPEAQREITSMLQDKELDMNLRRTMAQVSIFVSHPTADFLNKLTAQTKSADDQALAQTSTIALGAAIHRLSEEDQEAHQERIAAYTSQAQEFLTTEDLADIIPGATDWSRRRTVVRWLQGLGATRSDDIIPLIRPALKAQDRWIRGTAIASLRHLKSAEATNLVLDAIQNDPDPEVRERGIEAASVMGPERTLEAVEYALRKDKLKSPRVAAAYTISAWSNQHPKLVKILQSALEEEKDETVRETLRNYIEPNRSVTEKRGPTQNWQ